MRNKQDAGKVRFSLMPWGALRAAASVFTFGARKYEENGWLKQENAEARYLDAAMRHLADHAEGIELDVESGLPTLAHAVADLLIVLDLRSKVKGQSCPETTSRCLNDEQLRTMSGEEVNEYFGRGRTQTTQPVIVLTEAEVAL